jgi:hypothetical protein
VESLHPVAIVVKERGVAAPRSVGGPIIRVRPANSLDGARPRALPQSGLTVTRADAESPPVDERNAHITPETKVARWHSVAPFVQPATLSQDAAAPSGIHRHRAAAAGWPLSNGRNVTTAPARISDGAARNSNLSRTVTCALAESPPPDVAV